MRVLLVEDHAKLAMTLATGLRQAGMAVDVVFDGQDALYHLAVTPSSPWPAANAASTIEHPSTLRPS